ncbi:hypothetical protein GCM10020000_07920 [Streptomyces olivoverticillatus]
MTTPSTPEALVTGRLSRVTRRPPGRDTSTAARWAVEISSVAFSLRIIWSRQSSPLAASSPGCPLSAASLSRYAAPGVEVRLQQGTLAHRVLLQQPPFDGA